MNLAYNELELIKFYYTGNQISNNNQIKIYENVLQSCLILVLFFLKLYHLIARNDL